MFFPRKFKSTKYHKKHPQPEQSHFYMLRLFPRSRHLVIREEQAASTAKSAMAEQQNAAGATWWRTKAADLPRFTPATGAVILTDRFVSYYELARARSRSRERAIERLRRERACRSRSRRRRSRSRRRRLALERARGPWVLCRGWQRADEAGKD